MTWLWLALAGLAVVALLLLVALSRLRRRTTREIAAAHAEAAELRTRLDRLDLLEQQRAERARTEQAQPEERVHLADAEEFTITRIGDEDAEVGPSRLERAVFADHLLRESVIRVGSLAHGLRRALDPETRNRIRFEMRREVKRARKQRRVEERAALRERQARQRSHLGESA